MLFPLQWHRQRDRRTNRARNGLHRLLEALECVLATFETKIIFFLYQLAFKSIKFQFFNFFSCSVHSSWNGRLRKYNFSFSYLQFFVSPPYRTPYDKAILFMCKNIVATRAVHTNAGGNSIGSTCGVLRRDNDEENSLLSKRINKKFFRILSYRKDERRNAEMGQSMNRNRNDEWDGNIRKSVKVNVLVCSKLGNVSHYGIHLPKELRGNSAKCTGNTKPLKDYLLKFGAVSVFCSPCFWSPN